MAAAPRIVYLSWPAGEISGGIKAAFQHVEILREAGFDAAIATGDGQPPTWFASTAPMLTLDAVQAQDVLVFPENHAGLLERFAGSRVPKLVFCQNPWQVHRGLVQFCRVRFPALPVHHTPFFTGGPAWQDRVQAGLALRMPTDARRRPAGCLRSGARDWPGEGQRQVACGSTFAPVIR